MQFRVEVKDLGSEEFQGLECRKILIDTFAGGADRHHGWELWLAMERNLIPVRNLGYTYRWSQDIPIAESVVDEWKELRPGVWIPTKAHTDRYDSQIVKDEGKQVLRWQNSYEVRQVSLQPTVTNETFTKLEFPPGIKVDLVDTPR